MWSLELLIMLLSPILLNVFDVLLGIYFEMFAVMEMAVTNGNLSQVIEWHPDIFSYLMTVNCIGSRVVEKREFFSYFTWMFYVARLS